MDACEADGSCSFTPSAETCEDGSECRVHECDPVLGCVSTADDTLCDDGIPCTTDACSAESGSCSFTPDDSACANETECFAFACDGELGCLSQEVSGACDDGIPCTVDVCEGDGSCSNTEDDSACDDGNACTENTCEQENGVGCVVTNTPFGSPCDDGEGCAGDICADGVCKLAYLPSCNGECIDKFAVDLEKANGYCGLELNCAEHEFDGGDCTICPDPESDTRDCFNECYPLQFVEFTVGDGECNPNLNCPKFGYDAGDCTCAPGEIRDCNGACRASQDIGFELGDGKCDVFTVLGDSNVSLGCEKFSFDEGDCLLNPPLSPLALQEFKTCTNEIKNTGWVNFALFDPACDPELNCHQFDFDGGNCLISESECAVGYYPSCDPTTCMGMGVLEVLFQNLGTPFGDDFLQNYCDPLLNCEQFSYGVGIIY